MKNVHDVDAKIFVDFVHTRYILIFLNLNKILYFEIQGVRARGIKKYMLLF